MLSKDEANKLIRKRKGKEVLGEGSSRKVVSVDGYVIKRAKNNRGFVECFNEYYLYANDLSIRKYLCEVVYYEDGLIVMKEAKRINLEYFNKHIKNKEIFSKLIDYLIKKYDIDDFDLGHHFNWGVLENNIVIIDYGHTFSGEMI